MTAFARLIETETDKYGKIIKTIGLEKNRAADEQR
jgi:hypothetical protein